MYEYSGFCRSRQGQTDRSETSRLMLLQNTFHSQVVVVLLLSCVLIYPCVVTDEKCPTDVPEVPTNNAVSRSAGFPSCNDNNAAVTQHLQVWRVVKRLLV